MAPKAIAAMNSLLRMSVSGFRFFAAGRTEALQPQLSMLHEKSGRDVANGRNLDIVKTMCLSAFGAGKMRMTLVGPAVMSQFKMPGAAFQIGLVDQVVTNKRHQGSINRGLIRGGDPQLLGDLILGLRIVGLQQGRKNSQPRPGFPQSAGSDQCEGFMMRSVIHCLIRPAVFSLFLFGRRGCSHDGRDALRRI